MADLWWRLERRTVFGAEAGLELILTGRGAPITDHLRELAERKLGKINRLQPRVVRVEIELIAERNPRLAGTKRLEASLDIPRKTFRAHAEARDVDSAFDQLVGRLERQLRDHHEKRKRRPRRSNRLESARHEMIAPGD